MIIGIDLDSVVIDMLKPWLERYNKEYNDNLTPDRILSWEIHNFVKPECGLKMYNYLHDPSLYDGAAAMPGALYAITALERLGHKVIFVTTGVSGSLGRKFHWLVENNFLPDNRKGLIKYVEIVDKSLVNVDLLLDDSFDNVKNCRGIGVLYRQPWNAKESWPFVADGWIDFMQRLQAGEYIHPTMVKRPKQVAAFRKVMDKMFQVHLDKNGDYSPANVQGTGEIGLATRTWDKVARMMNLTGFDVEVSSSTYTPDVDMMAVIWNKFVPLLRWLGWKIEFKDIQYVGAKKPKNEALEDSIMDLAVYCMIWLIKRMGAWGV